MKKFGANKLKISAQIAAEKDQYLIDCFLDDGVIDRLIDNRFEIIAGRKGTGKTAIAQYLQKKYADFGIDYATRLTLSDFYGVNWDYSTLTADSLIKLLMVRTAQKLRDNDMLTSEGVDFWDDYLKSHGLQNVTNFSDWFIKAKKIIESKNAGLGVKGIANADLRHADEIIYEKQLFDESASTLASRLVESIEDDKKVIIIIDDLTDHLDHSKQDEVLKGLEQIKMVLHSLSGYNSKFLDDNKDLTFVCTIRDDLWDFIEGSNENKLKYNSLWLSWNEKSFCKLLIKRLPYFSDKIDDALNNPTQSIKEIFPDEVFEDIFRKKGINKSEIKKYATSFYSYVQLISFNRPRDYLRLCFALQGRLSTTKPVEASHIIAAEREYEMYFYNELKDELSIFSKRFSISIDNMFTLLGRLSKKSSMNYSEFRQIIASDTKVSSHKSASDMIKSLWSYSLVGYINRGSFVKFRHNSPADETYELPPDNDLKSLEFMLHRGIYWKICNSDRV